MRRPRVGRANARERTPRERRRHTRDRANSPSLARRVSVRAPVDDSIVHQPTGQGNPSQNRRAVKLGGIANFELESSRVSHDPLTGAHAMPLAVILGAILYVGVTWLVVMSLLAWAGGWKRLAQAYPAPPNWSGRKQLGRWIKIGWVDYNGCITYGVDAEGLRIALWPIFNIAHAPLYIPWTAMHVEAVTKQFGRGQVVRLAIGDPLVARISVPKSVFEAGKEALARVAPAPRENAESTS